MGGGGGKRERVTMKFSQITTIALGAGALASANEKGDILSGIGIQAALKEQRDATTVNPELGNSCTVTPTESCPISDMPRDETTMVYPGGKTRCIYSFNPDFAFQVNPCLNAWR